MSTNQMPFPFLRTYEFHGVNFNFSGTGKPYTVTQWKCGYSGKQNKVRYPLSYCQENSVSSLAFPIKLVKAKKSP